MKLLTERDCRVIGRPNVLILSDRLLGLIGDRVHSIAFVMRLGVIRVISLRKANKREVKTYETRSGID